MQEAMLESTVGSPFGTVVLGVHLDMGLVRLLLICLAP